MVGGGGGRSHIIRKAEINNSMIMFFTASHTPVFSCHHILQVFPLRSPLPLQPLFSSFFPTFSIRSFPPSRWYSLHPCFLSHLPLSHLLALTPGPSPSPLRWTQLPVTPLSHQADEDRQGGETEKGRQATEKEGMSEKV